MFTCRICHFTIELDDVELDFGGGAVVCERCYARLTESEKPMPKELRRSVSAAMEGVQ